MNTLESRVLVMRQSSKKKEHRLHDMLANATDDLVAERVKTMTFIGERDDPNNSILFNDNVRSAPSPAACFRVFKMISVK